MDFENFLKEQCENIINTWSEKDIYAISFLVQANDGVYFNNVNNFPEFSIGYNTESECGNVSRHSEERWNYAFWCQNNVDILSADNYETAQMLLDWYKVNNIHNIGEFENDQYDDDMNYIGKGPNGYYELLMLVSNIARELQLDQNICQRFGMIPIIVHDLEYCWYTKEATLNANPNGEAETFIEAYDRDFK